MYTRAMRALALAAAVAAPAICTAQIIDGRDIPSEFGPGALLATQRWQTGFGDDNDNGQFGFGSELDQLFVKNNASTLYIGLTGNLENNGNCIVILIDRNGAAADDGANPLVCALFGAPIANLPRNLTGIPGGSGFNNLLLDADFYPTHAIVISGGSPVGSQLRTYYVVNWVSFADINGGDPFGHTNQVAGIMTAGDPTASGASGTLGSFLSTGSTGILAAADNSGNAGVEGAFPPVVAANNPATQTTGFEFAIPLSLLGVQTGDQVCMLALVSGDSGYISNQLLPAVTDASYTEFRNLEGRDRFSDFGLLPGDQFVCYTIASAGCAGGPQCNPGDTDGDCDVDLTDLAILLSNFGRPSGATRGMGDSDGDGDVDLTDLARLLSVFGTNCN